MKHEAVDNASPRPHQIFSMLWTQLHYEHDWSIPGVAK